MSGSAAAFSRTSESLNTDFLSRDSLNAHVPPTWHSAARFVYDAPLFDLGVLLYPRLGMARHDHIRLLGIRIG